MKKRRDGKWEAKWPMAWWRDSNGENDIIDDDSIFIVTMANEMAWWWW